MKRKNLLLFLLGAVIILTFSACGGGGTGDTTLNPAGGTGQVALLLTDGPSEEYDQILITLLQIELLPVDGGEPVVVFDPAEPVTYDLLQLREEDEADGGALLALQEVPAGSYSKIRLEVVRVVGVKGASSTEFKLASGKIDLNPRGPFEVEAGITLAVTLDIDCDKSIHVSGNQKNFRPVVFVDIERARRDLRCPRVLQGTIASLTYGEDGETITGFEMVLTHGMVQVPILIDDASVIIDDQGAVTDAQALAAEEAVSVRGRWQEEGLLASMAVLGEVTRFDGIVSRTVTDDQFEITTATGDRVVELTEATLILWGCDQELSPEAIQLNMPARIFGKEQEGRIVAVAVLLKPLLKIGMLTAMEAMEDGYMLTIGAGDSVFLPAAAPIWIKNDGFLSPDELMQLVDCSPREVRITIADPEAAPPSAAKVVVLPESVETTARQIDADNRLLVTDAGTFHVKMGVLIMDLTPREDMSPPQARRRPVTTLDGIEPGDSLRVYALSLCPEADVDYEATLVLIVPPDSETE